VPNDWSAANSGVLALADGACGLTDGSQPGEWRIPTKAEWEATIAKALSLACSSPILTNDLGSGCASGGGSSFPLGIVAGSHWTSTFSVLGPTFEWSMLLENGGLSETSKPTGIFVWPVRSGVATKSVELASCPAGQVLVGLDPATAELVCDVARYAP
jgi:hypothetical protein